MTTFLENYNPKWKVQFDRIKQTLLHKLKPVEVDIQHVGSTSIPGMIAKPILDIDIIIKNKDLIKTVSEQLIQLGYKAKGEQGIPGRFAFRQTSAKVPYTDENDSWQEHHLYVCFADALALKNHLYFRDALLQDVTLASAYLQLKKQLTENTDINRIQYTKNKTEFILSVLSKMGLTEDELNRIREVN